MDLFFFGDFLRILPWDDITTQTKPTIWENTVWNPFLEESKTRKPPSYVSQPRCQPRCFWTGGVEPVETMLGLCYADVFTLRLPHVFFLKRTTIHPQSPLLQKSKKHNANRCFVDTTKIQQSDSCCYICYSQLLFSGTKACGDSTTGGGRDKSVTFHLSGFFEKVWKKNGGIPSLIPIGSIYGIWYLIKLLRPHATSPQKVAKEGSHHLISGKSRLVKYYSIWPDGIFAYIYHKMNQILR